MSGWHLYFWAICKALEISVVIAIWRAQAFRQWKWLVRLCAWRILIDVLGFYLLRAHHNFLFFYEFWAGEIVAILLQIGVLVTVYRFAFKGIPWSPRPAKILAGFVIVAALWCARSGLPRGIQILPDVAISAGQALSTLGGIALVVACGYCQYFGIQIGRRAFIVGSGLCVGMICALFWYSLHYFHPALQVAIGDDISQITDVTMRAIWLLAFLLPNTHDRLDAGTKALLIARMEEFRCATNTSISEPEVETYV